jgi:hypothetical protein
MQILNVTTLPIYLPYDISPVPFGDAFDNVSASSSATAMVWTVPGYLPNANDQVAFSNPGGNLDANVTVGQAYFVKTVAGGDTFTISATKGGSAIGSSGASNGVSVHLVSNQPDGPLIPFKPGYTVVALNMTGGAILLQGAADANQATPGNGYYPASQPANFSTLANVAATSAAIVQLSTDWINANANGLVLMQV